MKIEERKIYRCEFCNKYYIHKGHAKYHEKWCIKNPRFNMACFGCAHLTDKELETYFGGEYGDDEHIYIVPFCKKKNQFMYNPRIERLSVFKTYGLNEEQTRMPKHCEYFDNSKQVQSEEELEEMKAKLKRFLIT